MAIEKIAMDRGAYLNIKDISTREGISPSFYNGLIDDAQANFKWFGDKDFASTPCKFFNGMFYSFNLDILIAVADGIVYTIDRLGAATAISEQVLETDAIVEFEEAPAILEETET
jgi:hypothetical protein